MKKVINTLVLLLLVTIMDSYGQNLVQNGDFQNYTCDWNSNSGDDAFDQGCLGTQWKWCGDFAGGPDIGLDGVNYFTQLYSYDPATYNVDYYSDAIYYDGINFLHNTQYTVTLKVKYGYVNTLIVELSNVATIEHASNYFVTSKNTVDNANWQTVSFTFIPPNDSYTQICFYNEASGATLLYVDDIQITQTIIGDYGCCTTHVIYPDPNTNVLPSFTKAAEYIKTENNLSVVVSSTQNVTFQAGQYIELNPGFVTENSSVFSGYISPCPTTPPIANAGPDRNICFAGSGGNSNCFMIGGTASVQGESYSWASSPSNYLSNLSTPNASSTNVCAPIPMGLFVTYTLSATNGCGTSTDAMLFRNAGCRIGNFDDAENVTSIKAIDNSGQINYFPNPSNGKFYIKLPSDFRNAKVTIKDINGKGVFNKSLTQDYTEIELTNIPAGIYSISIESDDEIINDKIIIQ